MQQITAESENRLKTLSKALIDRPPLELEITGRADPSHDPEALKHRMLERKVKVQKLAEQVKKGQATGDIDEVELMPDEYRQIFDAGLQGGKVRKAEKSCRSDKKPASTGNGATIAGEHKRRRQRNARTR